MTEDILHRERTSTNNPSLEISNDMYNEALILLENKCMEISNKTLNQVGMQRPTRTEHYESDRDLHRERYYNICELEIFLTANIPLLQTDQRTTYEIIMEAVVNKSGGLFFIDAPGGTGKTFLISLLLAKIRSQSKIALAVASSGIAATLLDGGRTAHSAFKLPLNVQFSENPVCNINKNSSMGKVLQTCSIIVWDECTMAHKKSLEALDRMLKDFRNNSLLFGGALIVLAGDFRQTLPVIPRSTPADELNACLKSSYLWHHVQTLQLRTNMRVKIQNDASAAEFAKTLLDLGNGRIHTDPSDNSITFPDNFCKLTSNVEELINCVFPNIRNNFKKKTVVT